MAVKIGDVTIRIGASTAQLEADLRKAERALSASSKRFTDFGTKMTLGLTVPIAASGAAALQSFGDFERLQNALIAITGDANLAAEQFERLKVIAEAPGLALPQVVKASASLQAVGLSAQQAEETIKQYGNAVARSGGGAAEFDGAVLALTQIASKGKISAEELNQLGERIFEIRPALQAAFGTYNSEELQKLGISAQDFIALTTAELAKLQRVEGGLSNSFDNFRDSVTGSLAALGESISKSINLPKILDRISGALSSAADAFKELSPQSQRFVVILGATIAAIGPLAYVIGILKSAYGTLVIEVVKVASALIAKTTTTTAETAATRVATATTITFNTALRATLLTLAPYALALGAIVAVAYGISKAMGEANKASESFANIQDQVAANTAVEVSRAEDLIKVIRDETKSKNERNQALKDLKAISPEYFGGLTIEKDGIKAINEQFDAYIGNLKAAAVAQAASAEFGKIAIERRNKQKELNSEIAKEKRFLEESSKFDEARSRQGIDYAQTAAENSARVQEGIKNEIALLNQQEKELKDLIKQSQVPIKPAGGGGGGGGNGDKPLSDFQKQLKALEVELKNIDLLFNAGLIDAQERASQRSDVLRKKLELLVINGFSPASKEVVNLKNEIEQLQPKELKINVVSDLSDVNFEDIGLELAKLENAVSFGLLTPFDLAAEKTKVLQDQLKALSDAGVDPSSSAVTNLKNQITSLNDEQNRVIATTQTYLQLIGLLPGKFNVFTEKLSEAEKKVIEFTKSTSDAINAGLNQAIAGGLEAVGTLIGNIVSGEGAGTLKTFFNSILTVILDFAIGLGKQLIALGTATESLKKLFTNPVGAIIAGVGLIAVATIVKGIISKGVPSLAIGTDYVRQDGLAMIHKGEAIVPADVAKGGYSGGGGIANVVGRIQGTDIILASDYSMNFKNRIR